VNAYDPARWVDRYDQTANTSIGIFFGTQKYPEDRNNHLFITFGGAYIQENGNGSSIGSQGYYLLSEGSGYAQWHLTGSVGQVSYGISTRSLNLSEGQADVNTAYQIRCVKN